MVDLGFLVTDLSAISSIAVILGAVFVIFQLRQNARLIKTANFETKANMSFSVLEIITEESFARRRKNMHDAIKKYARSTGRVSMIVSKISKPGTSATFTS